MNKTAQQSLVDMLLQIMPSLQVVKDNLANKNDASNSKLYDIWTIAKNAKNRKVLKPANVNQSEFKKMIASGLIEEQGNYIKITDKGAQSLKVMILNDNTFALSKKASNSNTLGWYDKIKHEDYLS